MITTLLAFVQDARYGARSLVKSPLFTAAAVLSLGLSIGANSAMFSVFNAVLWRPMPVRDPGSLVRFHASIPGRPVLGPFSYPDVKEYADARVADDLAVYSLAAFALEQRAQDATSVIGEGVSGNYFGMLAPRMHLGRGIRPEEAAGNGTRVVVLGFGLWQRRFGGDPRVVGQTVRMSGDPFTIVGVASREFRGAYTNLMADEFWVPLPVARTPAAMENRRNRDFFMIGRLRPGTGIAEAQAAADAVAARLTRAYPDTNRGVRPYACTDLDARPNIALAAPARVVAAVFLAIASLVLLIACANVANLLLGRGTSRRREIATRLALGATRWQMVRQFLAESLVLSLAAGGLGLLVGEVATRALAALPLERFGMPIVLEAGTDLRVVLFTLAAALAASLAFGLVPALRLSRADLAPFIKGTGDATDGCGRRRRFSLTRGLVVAQVAISMLLLVVAGLFTRSVGGVLRIEPGFTIENRFVVQIAPSLAGYTPERAGPYYRALVERLHASPAIKSASLARVVPLGFGGSLSEVAIEGRAARRGEDTVETFSNAVDERYFSTIGTRVVAGRAFDDRDTASAPRVVMVNQTFAKKYWPGLDPLGRRIRLSPPDGPFLQVVGIVEDGKYEALFEPQFTMIYMPYAQAPRVDMRLVVEGRGPAAGTIAALRRELKASDPGVPVFSVKTMEQHMERQQVLPQLMASLIVPAGLLAAIIAVIGLYAVLAYAVGRRTKEIGIRVAVGAAPRDVIGLVMREGLAVAGVGLALGFAGAFGVAGMLASFLFGISPRDPVVFAAVPALLLAVALVACYVPARRALGVDALVSLRQG